MGLDYLKNMAYSIDCNNQIFAAGRKIKRTQNI
jgi:hypothetical protein